jgi:YTH domain-containing protein 1
VRSLAQLLPVDEDLREWLEITGYHNTEYRGRILNRRRAIVAIDAQKAKLLDEMEIDRREGLLAASYIRTSAATRPSPHITGEGALEVALL